MPHIAVSLYPGRDRDTKLEIANKLKDLMVRELNFPPDSISVSVVEIEPDNFVETIQQKYDGKDLYISSRAVKTST
ncbi:Tautomerase enzyme [Desulfitobacterium hafniense]|uniref:Tautomerase enzyme n=1 Tax=Desulfitobacterium hafniense TaxID=49338 RepID=A0A098AZS9_DESHA|nr:tautomerase family protein [Desulfitobacterium hafniense]CDX02144.1 Tautomerase enzyme [Desulfitobacterium hafniense]